MVPWPESSRLGLGKVGVEGIKRSLRILSERALQLSNLRRVRASKIDENVD